MAGTLLNIYRLTAPDNPFGRMLVRGRLWVQLLSLMTGPRSTHREEVARLCRQLVPTYTMLSVPRLQALYERILELDADQVPGAVVECGVWNGGASAMMAHALTQTQRWRDMWLFDSFEGLPPPTPEDPPDVHAGYHKGWCLGHLDMAREAVLSAGLPAERLHLVKGWFHETFPTVSIPQIALLHVDADWYAPVRLCLETFYDAVTPGGTIVLDDYGRWSGCKQATDEFLVTRGLSGALKTVDSSGAYFRKPLS